MNFSELYDKKYVLKCLLWLALVFGLMRATGGAGFAIVIPVVFYCLLAGRTEGVFFWMLVSVCALIVNPHLVPKGGGFGLMQRGLMLVFGCCMIFNVMAYPLHSAIRPYVGMVFYILVMVLSSAQGWNPKISYLKLILFSLIYFSYIGVANQVGINSQVSSRNIRSIMLSIAILFIVGSMALVPFPRMSQMLAVDFDIGVENLSKYTSLFMGMTNHSQCLGPIISVLSVALLGDLLFSIKKMDPLYLLLLVCCPYLIYLTSSRTGMGAYILGQMFVVWVFMNAREVRNRWKSRVLSTVMLIFVSLLLVIAFNPTLQDKATKFLLKTKVAESEPVTAERITSSRLGRVNLSLHYFRQHPLLGNGFQVSEEMKNMKGRGLTILSAPIEKGVWVTAVLEEGGIIGWVIFVVFLLACIIKSINRQAYIGASCLFVITMTNLGEFTFFSMSYSGGFSWAMVFVGLSLDLRKMEDENEAIRQQMEFEQMQMEMMGNGEQI